MLTQNTVWNKFLGQSWKLRTISKEYQKIKHIINTETVNLQKVNIIFERTLYGTSTNHLTINIYSGFSRPN